MAKAFRKLSVAIMGAGIGGLSAALSLRRAGHQVTVYERRREAFEVGASLSCAANGTKWLQRWGVDISSGRPVILHGLTMRDWKTGNVLAHYDMKDYERKWGHTYAMFLRSDMHSMLINTCTSANGSGNPVSVITDHACQSVDPELGMVTFTNGLTIKADLIIGADGIRSKVRSDLGVKPKMRSAPQTCFRCNLPKEIVTRLGLTDYCSTPAIQFWGGFEVPDIDKYFKIVMSPCSEGEIVTFYCFMPTEFAKQHVSEGFQFQEVPVEEILVGAYKILDPSCVELLKNSMERMPWRLYLHEPYERWFKGVSAVIGDAAHPMMPHQSQGACQAIEDAAALGIIFSSRYPQFTDNISAGLALYEQVRKPRATRVQTASRRATDNLFERMGFSGLKTDNPTDEGQWTKLTMEEINLYEMENDIESLVARGRLT